MKIVEVREQVRPTLKRCVELVLSGIKYRLFRAAITVAIIALAVAFLMTMLGESLITRRVAEAIEAETKPQRMLQFWVGRLSAAPNRHELTELLAEPTPSESLREEFADWGDLKPEQLGNLTEVAKKYLAYLEFFDALPRGERSELVKRRRGEDIFTFFIDEENSRPGDVRLREQRFSDFEKELTEIGKHTALPTSVQEFNQFLRNWYSTRGDRARIIDRHKQAVEKLHAPGGPLADRRPIEFLAGAGAEAIDLLAQEGVAFRISPGELETVRREAALTLDAEKIERMLASARLKAEIAKKRREKVTEVNALMLFAELESDDGAESFIELTNKAKGMKLQILTVQRLQEAAELALKQMSEARPAEPADPAMSAYAEKVAALAKSPLLREELAKRKPEEFEKMRQELERLKQSTGPDELAKIEEAKVTKILLNELMEKEDEEEGKKEGAEWLAKLIDRVTPLEPLNLTSRRIQEAAKWRLAKNRLAQTKASVEQIATKAGFMGFSTRTIWLLVVSFLVCVVGIANAMLMSVTERFREIATIKCLGATDGFVMISFVLESCMQGVAGSMVGLILGFALGTLRAWATYGWVSLQHMPALELLAASGLSVVLGILISALAAVYPAWVAARLAPMEAMRIE